MQWLGRNFQVQALNLDAGYTYDNEGTMTGISYPATVQASADYIPVRVSTPGPSYTYSLDTMHRATGMTDQSGAAANELLSLSYAGISENRTYNSMFQMTAMTVGGQTTQYTFPAAGQNAGKISLRKDVLSGEEVQYTYDSLNRLIAASTTAASDAGTATPWGQGFGYDGFGNLTAKSVTKGSAPVMTLAVNPLTNRITGRSYDANGNLLSLPAGGTGTYDAENRLVAVPGATYGYDGANKRIWRWTGSVDGYGFGNANGLQLYLYGVDGKQMGTYLTSIYTNTQVAMAPLLLDSVGTLNVYFRGKKVGTGQPGALVAFRQDRLGSSVKTYPYGEENHSSMYCYRVAGMQFGLNRESQPPPEGFVGGLPQVRTNPTLADTSSGFALLTG